MYVNVNAEIINWRKQISQRIFVSYCMKNDRQSTDRVIAPEILIYIILNKVHKANEKKE